MDNLKEPLKSIIESYCDVNAISLNELRHDLKSGMSEGEQQLREAIDKQLITSEAYEQLTGEDFDTQEDLQEWLEELWNIVNSK